MSTFGFMEYPPLSIASNSLEEFQQAQHGRGQRYEEECGHQEEHGWEQHLEGGQMSELLRPVPALHASRVGVDPEGLAERGPELLGLDECAHHGLDLLDARALS